MQVEYFGKLRGKAHDINLCVGTGGNFLVNGIRKDEERIIRMQFNGGVIYFADGVSSNDKFKRVRWRRVLRRKRRNRALNLGERQQLILVFLQTAMPCEIVEPVELRDFGNWSVMHHIFQNLVQRYNKFLIYASENVKKRTILVNSA